MDTKEIINIIASTLGYAMAGILLFVVLRVNYDYFLGAGTGSIIQ